MKYKQWITEWLENYVKSNAKAKTYERYCEIASMHLMDGLGNYEMSELTPVLLQRYTAELLENGNRRTGAGLSTNSVNGIVTVIQNSLKSAHSAGLIPENCLVRIQRPRSLEKQVVCFTPREQKLIEKEAMSHSSPKMVGVVICLYTGLRVGELLALEWADVDLKKRVIKVSKTCHDGKDKNGVFCRITDTPKTRTSNRIILLPNKLLPILRDLKRTTKCRSKYVIAPPLGQNVLFVRSYQRSFELLLSRLNIPHKGFHALRHTFATRALECGVDVKTLAEVLGHKNPTVTLMRYVHSIFDHKREMMNRLGKLL